MSTKSLALAAAVIGSLMMTAPAKADIATSLGLFSYNLIGGKNFFQSSLLGDAAFLSELKNIAKTSTVGQIIGAFVDFGNANGAGGALNSNTFTASFTFGTSPTDWFSLLAFDTASNTITFAGNTISANEGNNGTIVAVPGPEAGAGLGALAMAGVAYLAVRRRKQPLAA